MNWVYQQLPFVKLLLFPDSLIITGGVSTASAGSLREHNVLEGQSVIKHRIEEVRLTAADESFYLPLLLVFTKFVCLLFF
jgi:hypothetical protein